MVDIVFPIKQSPSPHKHSFKLLAKSKFLIFLQKTHLFKSVSFFTTEERLSLSKKMFESSFRVKVNDYEIKEKKATPTSQTLVHLQQKYDVKYIILGADNLKNITQWNRFKWLNEQITWVIATRKGYEFDTSVLRSVKLLEVNVDISSTQIRKKLNDKDKYHNEHG